MSPPPPPYIGNINTCLGLGNVWRCWSSDVIGGAVFNCNFHAHTFVPNPNATALGLSNNGGIYWKIGGKGVVSNQENGRRLTLRGNGAVKGEWGGIGGLTEELIGRIYLERI